MLSLFKSGSLPYPGLKPFVSRNDYLGAYAANAKCATVKDVARAAGVSVTTVSRVLNNPDLVVSEKQELVQRALRTLDGR
jgi:hypothetical protein